MMKEVTNGPIWKCDCNISTMYVTWYKVLSRISSKQYAKLKDTYLQFLEQSHIQTKCIKDTVKKLNNVKGIAKNIKSKERRK